MVAQFSAVGKIVEENIIITKIIMHLIEEGGEVLFHETLVLIE